MTNAFPVFMQNGEIMFRTFYFSSYGAWMEPFPKELHAPRLLRTSSAAECISPSAAAPSVSHRASADEICNDSIGFMAIPMDDIIDTKNNAFNIPENIIIGIQARLSSMND